MTTYNPPHDPPNYAQMAQTIADVAYTLISARRFSSFWRNLTSERIQERGEAYLDGTLILYEQCNRVMDPKDERISRRKYLLAQDAINALGTSGQSGPLATRKAKALCKDAYVTTKKASKRGLGDNVVGRSDPDPPAEAPPQAVPYGTDLPAGSSSDTPREGHGRTGKTPRAGSLDEDDLYGYD